LLRALEVIGMEYVVVGSIASGAHGEARATVDVDFLARITYPMIRRLAALLGDDFYFDVETAEEALRMGRSFNIMSNVEVLKFDFFPVGADEYGAAQLARKEFIEVPFLAEVAVPVISAEDVVLAKLRWYDQAGRVSERQWSDILGVLRVQGDNLDWAYIEEWAPRLGVADLLEKLPRYS
jgi:hypothetical protein